jgi:LysR family glycine cleavage system transcriptional activator
MGIQAKPRSGTYWAELRNFLEVAEAKSFNKAADQLGVSHPTVGRAVRRLEAGLNSALLVAGARGVALTPVGLRLAEALSKLDAEIARTMRRITAVSGATRRG